MANTVAKQLLYPVATIVLAASIPLFLAGCGSQPIASSAQQQLAEATPTNSGQLVAAETVIAKATRQSGHHATSGDRTPTIVPDGLSTLTPSKIEQDHLLHPTKTPTPPPFAAYIHTPTPEVAATKTPVIKIAPTATSISESSSGNCNVYRSANGVQVCAPVNLVGSEEEIYNQFNFQSEGTGLHFEVTDPSIVGNMTIDIAVKAKPGLTLKNMADNEVGAIETWNAHHPVPFYANFDMPFPGYTLGGFSADEISSDKLPEFKGQQMQTVFEMVAAVNGDQVTITALTGTGKVYKPAKKLFEEFVSKVQFYKPLSPQP